MRILSSQAMREVDRRAIHELGISSLDLMESAARSVVQAIEDRYPEAAAVAIFCGPGNNGGDGLAVGRLLARSGRRVELVLAAQEGRLSEDAAHQLAECRRRGLEPRPLPEGAGGLAKLVDSMGPMDLIVDALFGTGLERPLAGDLERLVRKLNGLAVPRLAVDIPSGLSGSRAEVLGVCVDADLTVTFAAPKIAHVLPPACELVGEWIVGDLGIPPALIEEADGELELLTGAELVAALPVRPWAAHKGDFGHLLVVAGSRGRSGAAVLAARAAIRSGAGLVTLAVPESLLPTVEAASLESMTIALPETSAGGMAEEAASLVLASAAGKSALAIGPGLGVEAPTVAAVRAIVAGARSPLVLDADGLNAFAGESQSLAGPGQRVLTPHPKELSRLMEMELSDIVADRPGAARTAAETAGSTVVLKGRPSLVADPGARLAVNPTGNPGMATGGTGDVLTGMIGALMAQGLSASLAARLGVFVHGAAGDLAAESHGQLSMSAGDLLERVPAAFRGLGAA